MKLLPNCREATALMLRAQDQALPLGQRLALRLHLLMCKACPRVVAQLALMQRASARWRAYSESGDAAD